MCVWGFDFRYRVEVFFSVYWVCFDFLYEDVRRRKKDGLGCRYDWRRRLRGGVYSVRVIMF